MPIVRRAYGVTAAAWLATLPIATFAATRAHASTLTHAFAYAVYSIGSLVCHQKPERSFHLWAAQLPVCARCTGIYLGAAAAVVVSAAQAFGAAGAARAALKGCATDPRRVRVWMFACTLPTIATLVFEWTTGIVPSNAIRFAAGLPIGVIVSWLVLSCPPQVN